MLLMTKAKSDHSEIIKPKRYCSRRGQGECNLHPSLGQCCDYRSTSGVISGAARRSAWNILCADVRRSRGESKEAEKNHFQPGIYWQKMCFEPSCKLNSPRSYHANCFCKISILEPLMAPWRLQLHYFQFRRHCLTLPAVSVFTECNCF